MYFIDEQISCYVHGITAQNKGSSKHVTSQLQTEKQMIGLGPLRKAMNDKSPVKIKKFEFNEKFRNIVIKNNIIIISFRISLITLFYYTATIVRTL